MNKSLLLAIAFIAPAWAQDAPQPETCPHQGHHGNHHPKGGALAHKLTLEKFDTNKDGKLDDTEMVALKDFAKTLKDARHAKMMEKFDTDKDGKLSDTEKAARKEARKDAYEEKGDKHDGKKHHSKGHSKGHSPEMMMVGHALVLEKYDTDKDGTLSDTEKAAKKADAQALAPKKCPAPTIESAPKKD